MHKQLGLTTIKLQPVVKYMLYLIWTNLLITGIWWWWDQTIQMNDPEQIAIVLIKMHGFSSAIMVFLLGGIFFTHVRVAFKRKKNQFTGLFLSALMLVLFATGVGLYYASESNREIISKLHLWAGFTGGVAFPLHIIIGHYLSQKIKKLKMS